MASSATPSEPAAPRGAPRGQEAARAVARFPDVELTVIGDAILDAYLDGPATRLSREAPVPVVRVRDRVEAPGGGANAAMNASALGARVRLVAVVGADAAGDRLLEMLAAQGVDVAGVVRTAGRPTATKCRILAAGHMLVRFDEDGDTPLLAADETRLLQALEEGMRRGGPLLVSDYRGGTVTSGVLEGLRTRRRLGQPLIVDAKDPRRYRAVRPTACTPSYDEASALLGASLAQDGTRAGAVARRRDALLRRCGAEMAVVTLDRDGAVLLEPDRVPHRIYVDPVPERVCAGAGDTFAAAFTLALATGADPAIATELGAAAAAVVVAKAATATCSAAELRLRVLPGTKLVPDAEALAAVAQRHRAAGRRIVFTNGCFDLLHRGHIAVLNGATALGDVLVVAVNGDESVRRLKGEGRPINPLADRIELVASLSCVDHVVPFDGDRPVDLIRALRPHVFVKGGDYREETVPEAPLVRSLGGEVRILDLVGGLSTTRIVERVRSRPGRD
jgi:D-beta-D-heptose 7-phosphate kinase/D-beta-D-heptose 1-phosphate adenosyltransferase